MSRPAIVVTTVQAPTLALRRMAERGRRAGMDLLVVGDTKTPRDFSLPGATYLSIEEQAESEFELARLIPWGNYARKNVGYLEAIASGAPAIFETDDDNQPLSSWAPRHEMVEAMECTNRGWVNVYRHFTDEVIWPRGFPLEAIRSNESAPKLRERTGAFRSPIQQGLANGSPDVDAVWRLTQDREITFRAAPSMHLGPGAWCPFNSQSTWWFPDAYPLLYLPSSCSFRMADIWRSLVAQRCLWEMGCGIVFHGPEMHQVRNEHELLRDFEGEVPGYLQQSLATEGLEMPMAERLVSAYARLVDRHIFPREELGLLEHWLGAVSKCTAGSAS